MAGETWKEEKEVQTQIQLPIDAYIPSEYIYDSMQKIEIYKKVASIQTLEEADDLHEELTDRFGDPPKAVENLLAVARLKVYGRRYGIETIRLEKQNEIHIVMEQAQNEKVNGQRLYAISKRFDSRVKFVDEARIHMVLQCRGLSMEDSAGLLEKLLQAYEEALITKEELHHAAK
jgi:transcription-repair coupling factor (superfamily II helicase)